VAILLPVAWNLLRMRMLARANTEASASLVLTAVQLAVLRGASQLTLRAEPTVREAMLAVAQLGGHRRRTTADLGDAGEVTQSQNYQPLRAVVANSCLPQSAQHPSKTSR
jgi:hypothetical protein